MDAAKTKTRGHRKGNTEEAPSSERSCIVCREQRKPAELLSLSFENNIVFPSKSKSKHSKRGMWVCAEHKCLSGLSVQNLSKALRTKVSSDALDGFMPALYAMAQERVLRALGLSRRSGDLMVGVERISESSHSGFILTTQDLSERSRRQLEKSNGIFLNGEEVGRALGMGWIGAVRIPPGHLAKEAAYWLRLWYESVAFEPENKKSKKAEAQAPHQKSKSEVA
ncbi:DUF448 domain-containing protein [Myxococcota bacterium]|nr:DUF448 domain-containing protein [Myxococcota bacterium]